MTVSGAPLVSVIIPCYNLGAYLDEAIQSVLCQTVQDFEIVVLDDGSTDQLTQSVRTVSPWPRMTVLHSEHRGVVSARNILIQHARGEYLCALDAADKLHPQYIEKTLAALAHDPSLTFVSSRLR